MSETAAAAIRPTYASLVLRQRGIECEIHLADQLLVRAGGTPGVAVDDDFTALDAKTSHLGQRRNRTCREKACNE
jgi:hypothetical protein